MLSIKKPSALTVLSFSFIFIIIATSVFISFISLNNEKKAVENLAKQLQVQIFVNIREKLGDYLAMPHRLNRLNADIIAQNPAIIEDLESLRPVYIRQIRAFETLATVAAGVEKQGNFVGVARREDEFFSSGLMNRDKDSTYRVSLLDRQGKAIRLLTETPDYDARTRPWYKTAAESGKAAWSPVYIWAAGTGIGITAALPVYDTGGSLIAVQQSALTLEFISSFIQKLRMEKSVQVFIAEPDGMLVASSDSEKVIRKGPSGFERIQAVESNTPFIRAASAHLIRQFGKMSGIPANYHKNTEIDGQRYFIAASALNDPHGLNWILITGLSESDVLAQTDADTRTTVLLCIIASLAAVWAALIIARRLASANQCLELEIAEHRHTEAALRESEAQFRSMFENHHAVMLLIDPENGKIIRANQGAEKFYGYSSEQFADMTIFQINQSTKEEIASELANSEAEKCNYFHFHHKLANGDIRDVEVHSSPIPFKEKTILFSVIHDITERRLMENALQKSEERYRKAQTLGHVGNWEYNIQTTRFWGSDEAKRIYGFDVNADSFTADEVEKCIPERERVHQALIDLIEKDKPYHLEFEIIAKDTKKRKTIVSIAEPERDESGSPLKITGVIHDITERKKAEEALVRSNRLLEAVIKQAPFAIHVLDGDIEHIHVVIENEESRRIMGETIEGRTDIDANSPETLVSKFFTADGAREIPLLNMPGPRAFRGEFVRNEEFLFRHPDGTEIFAVAGASPVYDPANQMIAAVVTFYDITDRKQAEDELRKALQIYRPYGALRLKFCFSRLLSASAIN